jgi:SAM-dependent methyltransferase
MDRKELLRTLIDRDGLGLEIGPLHSPVASKQEGWRVEILDHADAETLRNRYRHSPGVEEGLIEEVDHVSDGRPLPDVIGAKSKYDWIIASHVAEHVPDLLSFLSDCQAILKPGGKLVLALPDKRQCFDALRPISTTGAILEAHWARRTRHAPSMGFDFIARSIDLGGQYAWSRGQMGDVRIQHSLEAARAMFQALSETNTYHDLHGWVFVPASFRLIVEELYELGVCKLRETAFYPTEGIEFFIVLSTAGAGPAITRQELSLQVALEELDGLKQIIPRETLQDRAWAEAPSELNSAHAKLRQAEQRLAEALAAAAEQRRIASALLNSTSWRMTAPLRELATIMRSLSAFAVGRPVSARR